MHKFMKSQTSLIFVLIAVWVERLITWATRAETVTRDFNATDHGLVDRHLITLRNMKYVAIFRKFKILKNRNEIMQF
jgi:hypothetical protein